MKEKKFLIINYLIINIFLVFNIFLTINLFLFYNTDNIFTNNILKVVEIKVSSDDTNWGYATGCFISGDGTILTNKHVVFNSTTSTYYNTIRVRLANIDEWINAEILSTSETSDLAQIKIDKQNMKFFELEQFLKNGETIFTIGNPNGFGLSFTSGVVSSNIRNIIYNEETIPAIQTSFIINEGNSGGPVFNRSGYLVGLISFRLKDNVGDIIQGVSFAIPSSSIINYLQS